MVGMFVNILAVVISDRLELPMSRWLQILQEKLLKISEYESVTAEQIAQADDAFLSSGVQDFNSWAPAYPL